VAQTVIAQAKRDLMSRARDIGDKALAALEAVLDDPHASSPARVSAAVAVLDRGYGKPPQLNTSSVDTLKKATEMTDDELAAIARGGSAVTHPPPPSSDKLN
jgi:hypothetical protein